MTLGAGTVFDDFCERAAAEGLWGPENLSLIPGEVGASAVQNIGAYGVEAKDIIVSVHAWDLQERRFVDIPAADCAYGYRTSRFKTEWKGRYIITAVTFRLSRRPQPKLDYGGVRKALEDRGVSLNSLTPGLIRETIIGIRREKLPDPSELGSAGSFFKNPVISREHFARIVETARSEMGPEATVPHFEVGDEIKVPAAWMIDRCGFKGQCLGGAQVYPRQPLVLVNATGRKTGMGRVSYRETERVDLNWFGCFQNRNIFVILLNLILLLLPMPSQTKFCGYTFSGQKSLVRKSHLLLVRNVRGKAVDQSAPKPIDTSDSPTVEMDDLLFIRDGESYTKFYTEE